jgi:putative membrane protein
MFLLAMVVGFLFELLGTNTGIPFGIYEYTAFEGVRIFGVPIPVILAWGIYITMAYLLSSILVRNNRWLFASIFLVTLDLAVDPIMVSRGLWIWYLDGGISWFGVPYTNFIGWFIVVSLTVCIYELSFSVPDFMDVNSILVSLTFITLYLPLIVISDWITIYAIIISVSILLSEIGLLMLLRRSDNI